MSAYDKENEAVNVDSRRPGRSKKSSKSSRKSDPLADQKKFDRFVTNEAQLPLLTKEKPTQWLETVPYCLQVHKASGVQVPEALVEGLENPVIEHLFQLTFYHVGSNSFFGQSWSSPPTYPSGLNDRRTEGGRVNIVQTVPFGQRLYFHSTINDPSVLLVLELVAIAKVDNVVVRELGVGWTVLRVFNKVEGRRPDTSDRALDQLANKTSAEIFQGTPRGLVFLEEPLEPSMHKVPGCTIIFSLLTHEMMREALPLMPENSFVGHQTLVPGIMRAKSVKDRLLTTLALPFVGYSDPDDNIAVVITPLAPPKLCPVLPMEVCESNVILPPSFERVLLRQMDFDRWQREDIKPPGDGRSCKIVSRRLHVGVHNGRRLIGDPSVVVLKPGRLEDGTPVLDFDGIVNLGLVPKDAMCAVVMELEYTIEVPIAATANPLVPKSATKDVCVGYLAHLYYNPKTAKLADGVFSRAFTAGPGRSAMSNRLVFSGLDTDYSECLEVPLQINFTVVMGDEVSPSGPSSRTKSSRGKRSIRSQKTLSKARSMSSKRRPSTTTETSDSSSEPEEEVASSSSRRSSTPSAQEESDSSSSSHAAEKRRIESARRRSSKRDKRDKSAQRRRVAELEEMSRTPQVYSAKKQAPRSRKKATPLHPHRNRLLDDPSPPPTAMSLYDDELQPASELAMRSPRTTHMAHGRMSLAPAFEHHGHLSRATKAKLHRAGLQGAVSTSGAPVMEVGHLPDQARKKYGGVGSSGKPPEAKHDKLRLNEITIQFLAFAGPSAEQPIQHKNLYFTFQFYVFPQISTERLNILQEAHEASNEPHVLVRSDGEGLQVKFSVDPAYMRRDEDLYFLDYLQRKALHVEVWDGDSMLQIGTVRVDLRGILRNGLEAIQMTEEYEILDTQMIFDSNATVDVTQQHANALRGRLHLRISNLGKTSAAPLPGATLHEIQFSRGEEDELRGVPGRPKPRKHKVKTVVSSHHDLANMLQDRSRQLEATAGHVGGLNPDEERHLQRVEALKKARSVPTDDGDAAVTLEMQRMERLRKLRTIAAYRNKLKSDRIQNMLRQNISANKTIFPSYGQLIYFEFPLKNPYRQSQTFSIEVEDTSAELGLVTNPNEYNFYREVYKHEGGPLDENLFDTGNRIYTDALETVLIPFKFQSFQSGLVPYDPRVINYPNVNARTHNKFIKNKSEKEPIEPRTLKVIFKNDAGAPVYILNVHIQPQPFVTDQTLRFYQAENSFLKETIRIDNNSNTRLPLSKEGTYDEALVRRVGRPSHRTADRRVSGEKYLVCSHDGVIATSQLDQDDLSIQDISIKYRVGHSPDVTRFYLVLYRDKYHASLFEIWEVFVYSQQRLDVNAVVGEASKGSLVLRGGHSSRLVHTYSSSPSELRLEPEGSFSVVSGALNEITFQIQPFSEGKRKHRVHVVDEETKDLLAAWLVVTTARLPPVWKDYELQLPVRSTSNKKISYKNQYNNTRTFYLRTDRPNLLQFKDEVLDIPGQQTRYIGLKFLRYPHKAVKRVYVFINDQDEKNVDMMCIKLNYT